MSIVRKLVTGDRVRGSTTGRAGEVQGPGANADTAIVRWDGETLGTPVGRDWLDLVGSPAVDEPAAMPDMIDHPPHYTSGPRHSVCGEVVEVIDLTEGAGFCLGNVLKYVLRSPHKGAELADLRKARWYLDRHIARLDAEETSS